MYKNAHKINIQTKFNLNKKIRSIVQTITLTIN